VNDVDAKAWVDAAQTYQRLRQRTLLLTFIGAGSFVGFAFCLVYASAKNWDALAGTLFLIFLPVSVVPNLVVFIASLDLRGFRCPQCGGKATSWGSQLAAS
jgi:hypothetical protein